MAEAPQGVNKPGIVLPGQGVVQPTPAQRAAVEDKWNDPIRIMTQVLEVLREEGKPAADDLLHWINSRKNKNR